MKKQVAIAALGVLLFSSAAPVVARTNPVVLNQGLITKYLVSSDSLSSRTSATPAIYDRTSSGSNDYENQEQKTKIITPTAIQTKGVINNVKGEVTESDCIASGTFGTSPWRLDTDGVLHLQSGKFSYNSNKGSMLSPWNEYEDKIKQITFEGLVTAYSDSSYLFADLGSLVQINNLNLLDTSQVTNMSGMFFYQRTNSHLIGLDLSNFDTSNVTNMSSMFSKVELANLDLSNFDTSNVTNMNSMFSGARLGSLDISSFSTSKVIDMSSMFSNIELNSLDLSNFDTTNVTDMSSMFSGSRLSSLDVSNFNTSKVTNMSGMFMNSSDSDLSGLKEIDLSSFDTSNVTVMSRMFFNCGGLTGLDLSTFNTRRVQSMKDMFSFIPRYLKKLTLGPDFIFGSGAGLQDITRYTSTGKWQNVGTGTESSPNGKNIWSSGDLMTNYDGSNDADTYVWQPSLGKAADVTIKYINADGYEIHKPQIISGDLGKTYDASGDTYKLSIDGYTLDSTKLPDNATGALSDTAQIIIYRYEKNKMTPSPAKPQKGDDKSKPFIALASGALLTLSVSSSAIIIKKRKGIRDKK